MIPVAVVTGFLGAGKTTLLRALLRSPDWAGSAVIVNEFGEVALDHDLIAAGDDTLLSVSTGCLCCAVGSSLGGTLLDLARRRAEGVVPPYARVLVETSGLADPVPVLHALLADPAVAREHVLAGVVAVVDAQRGAAVLDRHPEARRQVAAADRVVVSKPDLAAAGPLLAALRAVNPAAPVREAVRGMIEPGWLFPDGVQGGTPAAWLDAAAQHTPGVGSIVIEREAPIGGAALLLWLEGLAEHAGHRLLRLKGIVGIAEEPDRPAALHGVGHLVQAPEWLDRWPAADRTCRIVLIGQGIPAHWPARLLDAIEAEAAAAGQRPASASVTTASSAQSA